MVKYYGRFSKYGDDEDDEKKLKPSQVAREEQKEKEKKSSFGRFEKHRESIDSSRSKPQDIKPQEEEEEPKKKSFIEKAKEKYGQVKEKILGKGVKSLPQALFGKKGEVEKTETGKPITSELSDDEWAKQAGLVQQYKVQALEQLNEAERSRSDYYQGGKIKQVNPILDKRVDSLKRAIRNYDEFLGNEQSNRGFFKEMFDTIKQVGVAPDYYESVFDKEEMKAVNKYKDGEELTKTEQGYVNSFRAKAYQDLIKKGYIEASAAIPAMIPKYGMEIAMYSQLGSTGSIAQGLAMKLPQGVLRRAVPAIVKNSVNMAVASELNVPGIDAKTAHYMTAVPDYEKAIGEGKDLLTYLEPGDTPEKAKTKARLSQMIEYISEGVGTYIDDAVPLIKNAFIAKFLKNKGVTTNNSSLTKEVLSKIKFDSLVTEVIEEEIAEPFQAKLEDREYLDPFFTPEGRERLLVEVLGIGAFAGMAKVPDTIQNKILKRRKDTNNTIKAEVDPNAKEPEEETPPEAPPVPPVVKEAVKEREEAKPVVEITKELKPLAEEAKKAKDVSEFVSGSIFERSISGEEALALEKIEGKTTADKLETLFNEATKEPVSPTPPPAKPVVPTGVKDKDKQVGEGTYYRGVAKGKTGLEVSKDKAATYGQGIYLSDSSKIAKEYAGELGKGSKVVDIKPIKELNLYTPTEAERLEIVSLFGKEQMTYVKKLLGDKYNGLKIPEREGDGNEIVIYDKNLLKSKSIPKKPPPKKITPKEAIKKAKEVERKKKLEKFKPKKVVKKKKTKPVTKKERQAIQEHIQEVITTGETPQDTLRGVKELVSEIKPTNRSKRIKELKAMRAEMNRSIFDLAGANTGNWKRDYAVLQSIKGEPSISPIIDKLEEGIAEIDEITEKKAPGGFADVGGYADVKSLEKRLSKIKAIELPELVRMARDMMGETPSIKKFRTSLGKFYGQGTGVIKLDPKVFKKPELAAKVLAHELGHLADYMPDKNLKRGNLIGRIATLNKFLKNTFGGDLFKDKPGLGVSAKELREELKALTQTWKPFDESINKGYTSYRYSSKELYADAISVLFNDPDLLKQKAPRFWQAFFDHLDAKPSVKENFFAIWDLLNLGEEAVLSKRQESIRESFQKGEDQFAILRAEKAKARKDFVFRLKYELVDKNQRMIDLVKEAKETGKKISDDANPIFWLEEQNYVGGVVKNWAETNIQPIYKEIIDSGLTWEDFGEVLYHERVVNERGDLANPLGFQPKSSKEQLAHLEKTLGKEGWGVIKRNLPKYRKAIKQTLKIAEEAGLYKPELVKQMKANPSYATFQVIDYMDLNIPASVKQQVGTLKEIANPATSTIIKTISVIRAAERNKAKAKTVDFLKDNFEDQITDAKTIWTGQFHKPIESKDRDEGLFVVLEKGDIKGYYVDKYIAESMKYTDTGHANAVVSVLRFFNSKLFRPMFITFNLGFQSFNLMRDFTRTYKNIPSLTLARTVRRYIEAVPASVARGFGLNNKTIQELEKAKILGITYNDIISGITDADKQIEAVIAKVGLSPLRKKKTNFFWKPFKMVTDFIENLGDTIETLPKVAGYKELNGKLPSKALASKIRTEVGSPDFLRKGAGYKWYNEVFLFSNAIKEGVRSDIHVATNPKTRSGFWWKTTKLTFLPKMLMFGALMGLFGDELKKMLEDVSEYDKTNYIIAPLGKDKNNKTVYMRVPQDEFGRLLGGILWKGMRISQNNTPIMKDLTDLLSFTGGQIPSVSPTISSFSSIAQFVAGKNPYDSFRGRNVLTDDEFEAGGKYALKPFVTWQLKQLGAGVFMKGYVSQQPPATKTWTQKVIEAPLLSNIVGRWVKVSDYGQREKNKELVQGLKRKEATRRIEEREILNEAVREYKDGDPSITRRRKIERELVKEIVGTPKSKADKAKITRLRKKFKIAIIKGEADQNINSIISAQSNVEKVELLRQLKDQMDNAEYKKLFTLLRKEKIISNEVVSALRRVQ